MIGRPSRNSKFEVSTKSADYDWAYRSEELIKFFGGDPVPDTDSVSIFHFPDHYGIGDLRRFINLLAFPVPSPASFHDSWQNDSCLQGVEIRNILAAIRQTFGFES